MEEVRSDDVDGLSEFSSALGSTELDPPSVKDSHHMDPTSSPIIPSLDLSAPTSDLTFPSPSTTFTSLPSSTFSSRPMSPIHIEASTSRIEAEYDDPWADSISDMESMSSGPMLLSDNERSSDGSGSTWQNLGVLEFSAQHLQR